MPTQIDVSLSVTKLIEESPNVIRDAIFGAVLADEDISDAVREAAEGGMFIAANRFYNYGVSSVTQRVPLGKMHIGYVNPATVEFILKGIHGEDVLATSADLLPIEPVSLALAHIQLNYGFDNTTNIVSNPPFVASGVVTYDSVSDIDFLTQSYVITYLDGSTPVTETVQENVKIEEEWVQVEYHLISDDTKTLFWNYDTHIPFFDPRYQERLSAGVLKDIGTPYFPIVTLKRNGVHRDIAEDTVAAPVFRESEYMLRQLGMDMTHMIDNLKENPHAASVDDAFVMLCLDIRTKKQESIQYLYEFARHQLSTAKVTRGIWQEWRLHYEEPFRRQETYPGPRNTIRIDDDEAKYSISFAYAESSVQTGLIDVLIPDPADKTLTVTVPVSKIGECSSTYIPGIAPTENTGKHRRIIDAGAPPGLAIRKQLTMISEGDATDSYTEITLFGLVHTSHIMRGKVFSRGLSETEAADYDGGFFIPLNYELSLSMAPLVRNLVLYDSVTLVINAIQRTHLEWYETALFRDILIIAIIVIAVITQQPALGKLITAVAATATVTAALTVILKFVLVSYIEGLIVSKALRAVAKRLGTFGAIIAAVVIAAVTGRLTGVSMGRVLLNVSNAVMQGIKAGVDVEVEQLIKDMDALGELEETREAELKAAQALLDTKDYDLMAVVRSNQYDMIHESPESFLSRTMMDSPADIIVDEIELFTDYSMELPELGAALN